MATSKTIKPLYKATELKKTSNAKLWVTFKAGTTPSKGLVYSATLTRDQIRNDFAKRNDISMSAVRARRVSNMTSRRLKNTK